MPSTLPFGFQVVGHVARERSLSAIGGRLLGSKIRRRRHPALEKDRRGRTNRTPAVAVLTNPPTNNGTRTQKALHICGFWHYRQRTGSLLVTESGRKFAILSFLRGYLGTCRQHVPRMASSRVSYARHKSSKPHISNIAPPSAKSADPQHAIVPEDVSVEFD